MKTITIFLLINYLSIYTTISQNLVPNFSFEDFTTCPYNVDQIQFTVGWYKCSSNSIPTNTSPDYYNSCSPDSLLGIPNSMIGYQFAHRNCNAYVGLVTFSSGYNNYREQIGIQLSSPLILGQKYFLSFYTVMGGDVIDNGYYYTMPSNNIGIQLSTIAYNASNPAPINNFAHINLQNVFSDTANWTQVSGSFIADSAYQYLMLGNFFDDSNTDTLHLNCPQCLNNFGYFLVDDVCLSTDSLFCNGGIDLLPCITGLNEAQTVKTVLIYPNPVKDIINISTNDIIAEINISDVLGHVILHKFSTDMQLKIDFSEYPKGLYLIKINTKNNISTIRKIIKF